MPFFRAKYLTNSKDTMQISEIEKHTNQSKQVRYINIKFNPTEARAT